jgi:hypothetical protein
VPVVPPLAAGPLDAAPMEEPPPAAPPPCANAIALVSASTPAIAIAVNLMIFSSIS